MNGSFHIDRIFRARRLAAIEGRLERLEEHSHPAVTPIVSAQEFDKLVARVRALELWSLDHDSW